MVGNRKTDVCSLEFILLNYNGKLWCLMYVKWWHSSERYRVIVIVKVHWYSVDCRQCFYLRNISKMINSKLLWTTPTIEPVSKRTYIRYVCVNKTQCFHEIPTQQTTIHFHFVIIIIIIINPMLFLSTHFAIGTHYLYRWSVFVGIVQCTQFAYADTDTKELSI